MTHIINRPHFYETVKATLFPGAKLKQQQVAGMEAILNEWETNYANSDDRWLAYMLATAFHETATTMQPIEEYGKGKGKPYGTNLKIDKVTRYTDTTNIFYGRGLVQLTWYDNYQKAGKKTGLDLIQHPEKALETNVSVKIMFLGMIEGWFTGKKLSNYFGSGIQDWKNARRIINGLDRADMIADYGKKFYSAISYMTV